MCITNQASLMAARHHWLEMIICFRAVHRFICILVIAGWRSRQEGLKAKLMVTTSHHVSVNMADFGDDPEIEGDVLAAKRSHGDDDTSGGESDGTSGTSASTASDAESVDEKRRRRGAHRKPRPPRKETPPAIVQLCPALQSELRKLQHVATRGGAAEWDKVCKAGNKAISLLQPGSRTAVVAATITSHATGGRGQFVFEISAMDANDNCESVEIVTPSATTKAPGEEPTE